MAVAPHGVLLEGRIDINRAAFLLQALSCSVLAMGTTSWAVPVTDRR